MSGIAQCLADDGFTCLSIDYTLAHQGTRWPTQLQDVQAAARYLRSHATELKVDPNEIAAAGVSAGGHLSLFLGVKDAPINGVSSKVQAVGSISGVLDLNLPMTTQGEPYRIEQQLLVDVGEPTFEQKKQASPVTFISKATSPTFLIQGTADPLVPPNHSSSTAKRLALFGVPMEFRMVNGMGHGLLVSRPEDRKALEEFSVWLKKKLKVTN
jgi:acetyl esterase/lipase